MALRILAERSTVTADPHRPTTILLEVTGWSTIPAASLAYPGGEELSWVSVHRSVATVPDRLLLAVVFDPARGRRARPGTHLVDVHVRAGDDAAEIRLAFVVRAHPCLEVRPRPTFTWNPLTNTATIGVSMWSCGNVDLDVSWSAGVRGRRVQVDTPSVQVGADGVVVPATLTVSIPDGKVDAGTEIDLLATSQADAVATVATSAGGLPVRRRGGRRFVVGAAVVALLSIGAAAAGRGDDDGDASSPTVEGAVTAPVTGGPSTAPTTVPPTTSVAPTTTAVPTTTAAPTTTVAPTTSIDTTTSSSSPPPPPPARIVVEGVARQAMGIAVGDRSRVTFTIANRGGSDAIVRVVPDLSQPFFEVSPGACVGVLAPADTCTLVVAFVPTSDGVHTERVAVIDDSTATTLEVVTVGTATIIDLVAAIEPDPWSGTGCPTTSTACFHVRVRNDGVVAAPATTVLVTAGNLTVPIRSLQPNETLDVPVDVSAVCGKACPMRAVVDPSEAVPETSELNNFASWTPGV